MYHGYTETREQIAERWERMKAAADSECGHRFQDWRIGKNGEPYCLACAEGARPDIGDMQSMADKIDRQWTAEEILEREG